MALENAVAKYTVSIVQDGSTAPAVAEFNNLRSAALDASTGTTTATNSLRDLRETSMLTRESTRVLAESSILLGGNMGELAKGALMASEGMRVARTAALLFKVELSELLLPFLGIAAAVGAGFLLWEEYGGHMDTAAEKAQKLSDALEKLPAMLKEITEAQNAGLLSDANAQKYQGELSGSIPLFQSSGSLGGQNLTTDKNIRNTRTGANIGQRDPATQAQIQAFVQMQELADHLNETQVAAANELKKLHDQDAVDSLIGVQKEIAAENQRYQDELTHIKELHDTATAAGGKDNSSAGATADSRHATNLQTIQDKEDIQIQNDYNEMLREQDALDKQIYDDDQRLWAQKTAALNKATEQEKQLQDLENKITLDNLTGEARKQQAIVDTTNAQIAQFQKLGQELGLSQNQIDQWIAKIKSGAVVQQQSLDDSASHLKQWESISDSAANSFSGGMASAFVQFAEGTKTAGQAFAQFATQFLSQLAEMILQSLILRSVMAFAGGFGGGAGAAGGIAGGAGDSGVSGLATFAAGGGFFPRMMAAGGFAGMVNSATYFPRFNVVGGEAGAEMMAALARPTFRSLGGIDAIVGNAGNQLIALTNAADLDRRGGAGGTIQIQVTMHPDLKAEIINSSVKGAQVQVAQDLGRNTPISKGVKNLTA